MSSANHATNQQNESEEAVLVDCAPVFRQYISGRVERLLGKAAVPPPANSKDVTITSSPHKISARLFLPSRPSPTNGSKLPILVYYHGGAFCIESAFSPTYHDFLTKMAEEAGMVVVSIDYRLAPENLLPAAYEDAWVGLEWVFSVDADEWVRDWGDLGRVWVGGDSAGANMAHHMALRAGSTNAGAIKLEGMILVHSYFWGSENLERRTVEAGIRAFMEKLWKSVTPPEMQSLDHPSLNPMAEDAPSLRGLGCKRIIVCVAEKDLLVDRGNAYYEAVKKSGWEGDIELFQSDGEEHVFHLTNPDGDRALQLEQVQTSKPLHLSDIARSVNMNFKAAIHSDQGRASSSSKFSLDQSNIFKVDKNRDLNFHPYKLSSNLVQQLSNIVKHNSISTLSCILR